MSESKRDILRFKKEGEKGCQERIINRTNAIERRKERIRTNVDVGLCTYYHFC